MVSSFITTITNKAGQLGKDLRLMKFTCSMYSILLVAYQCMINVFTARCVADSVNVRDRVNLWDPVNASRYSVDSFL